MSAARPGLPVAAILFAMRLPPPQAHTPAHTPASLPLLHPRFTRIHPRIFRPCVRLAFDAHQNKPTPPSTHPSRAKHHIRARLLAITRFQAQASTYLVMRTSPIPPAYRRARTDGDGHPAAQSCATLGMGRAPWRRILRCAEVLRAPRGLYSRAALDVFRRYAASACRIPCARARRPGRLYGLGRQVSCARGYPACFDPCNLTGGARGGGLDGLHAHVGQRAPLRAAARRRKGPKRRARPLPRPRPASTDDPWFAAVASR